MRPPRGGGSFRGGGRGGRGGGAGGGRGGGGGRFGGGRGGFGGYRDEGPPAEVVEVSTFLHACEGEAVTRLTNEKVPYFNAPIYLQNKTQIGKVEEIFGPINEAYFSVKMMEGIIATSYTTGDKFYVDPAKLLPLQRFLPQPKDPVFKGLWYVVTLIWTTLAAAFGTGWKPSDLDRPLILCISIDEVEAGYNS